MSHVTDVKLRIRDLDSLRTACDGLGLDFRENQRTYAWWGSYVGDSHSYGEHKPEEMGKCAHAIRVKGTAPQNGSSGPWEIGVVPAKDGDGFNLYYDTYGGAGRALTDKVGAGAARLRHAYAVEVAEKSALAKLSRSGWKATRETVAPGRTRIKLRKR
jgi:hypothetical protein